MQFKNIALLATALTAGVSADFVVISVPTPSSINLGILQNPASYINSLQDYVTRNLASLTADASAVSRAASAKTALESFVKTATVSVPTGITGLGSLETFTSVPAWYSALPSDLKSYYDSKNSQIQNLVNQAVLGTAASGPSGASAAPSRTGGSGSQSTGAAASDKTVQYIGAGMVAAFAGVLAL